MSYAINNYQKLSHREHVLTIPDTYIGSATRNLRTERIIFMNEGGNFSSKDISLDWPEGAERTYLEILYNAADNAKRSYEKNINPGVIDIKMDQTTITITNSGLVIPIGIMPGSENTYVPESIFGELLTSSNYDQGKEKSVSGRNGYGAKITNVFSKYFSVSIFNPEYKKSYFQYWQDNMGVRIDPIIQDYNGNVPQVQVQFMLDFPRFGYTDGYPPEVFYLYMTLAANISFTCKIPVIFNDIKLDFINICDYAKLMFNIDNNDDYIIHYEWPAEVLEKVKKHKNGSQTADKILPIVELCLLNTPNEGKMISFANNIYTRDGGVHVNEAIRKISDDLIKSINEKSEKKITISSVKKHVTLILSCHLVNTTWNAQSKTKLEKPTPKITFEPKEIKKFSTWGLVDKIYDEIDEKRAKNKKVKQDRKLKDANYVKNNCGKNSECTLFVTEGDSAKSYIEYGIGEIPGGWDTTGILPLRGVILNVSNASRRRYDSSQVIGILKNSLGLQDGIDYSIAENFSKLRYGRIVVLTDADDDGKHILGLILLFFHKYFRELINVGYVCHLRTPIIRVGNMDFISRKQFEDWLQANPNSKSNPKYCKGLGSSTQEEIKRDCKNSKYVTFYEDEQSDKYFDIVFNKEFSDQRKVWLATFTRYLGIEEIQYLPVSSFLYYEVIDHSLTNLRRAIPGFDGLKVSQRKIIWGSMLKWGKKASKEYIKTAQLAANIAENTGYHHGEGSLSTALSYMTMDFCGSNNMPYFQGDGNFGTRSQNGKNFSSPRYTTLRPSWWWPFIYKEQDNDILNILQDEGQDIEPSCLLPIIPMGLINGCNGIATGYSTFIPNYKPYDICYWFYRKLKMKIENLQLEEIKLTPWYRYYSGVLVVKEGKNIVSASYNQNMKIPDEMYREIFSSENVLKELQNPGNQDVNSRKDVDNDDNQQDDDNREINNIILENKGDEINTEKAKLTLKSFGSFSQLQDGRIIITELPIGRSKEDYEEFLKELREKNIIKQESDKSSNVGQICFEIVGFEGKPDHNKLKLIRSFGISNITFITEDNHPKVYRDIIDYLEDFYNWRLDYYQLRKNNILKKLTNKITLFNEKVRFIRAVIDGTIKGYIQGETIVIMKQSKNIIYQQMDYMNLSHELLVKTNLSHCTEEEIEKLLKEVMELENEKNILDQKSPEMIWLEDILLFNEEYKKHYDDDNIDVVDVNTVKAGAKSKAVPKRQKKKKTN